jgi:hypothetical protein
VGTAGQLVSRYEIRRRRAERQPARRGVTLWHQGRRHRARRHRTEWAAISADNLEASSAGTVYRDQAKIVSGALRAADRSRVASGPEVVAAAIGKAVQLRRPRTRYAVGGGARSILLAQRLLTDRGFDRFIRLTYRAIS